MGCIEEKMILKHLKHRRAILVIIPLIVSIFLSPISQSSEGYTKHASAVAEHGMLKVVGNRICDASGDPVQLKGMSLFWSQWSTPFWNKELVHNLASTWNVTLIRAPLGIDGDDGYLENPEREKQKVITVVDAAIDNGIYVIIDWHAHDIHLNEAVSFFTEMAQRYKNVPNVIFEIFNEPDNESWSEVKTYALEVIGAIRSSGAQNLIIVGTPTWSQDVDKAANDPIKEYNNIAYALHFYAGTHKQWLRDKATDALSKGVAIFVSEWGTCDASGNGNLDLEESQRWIDFMNLHKLSWANWAMNDKNETASALTPGASTTGPWPESQLTESGKFVKAKIMETAPASGAIETGILRGVNHAHTWYPDKLDDALQGIRAWGANSVRIVLSNGYRWTKNNASDVANVISKAKEAGFTTVILEVHDTTGYGEDSAACSLKEAVAYWKEIQSVLTGKEDFVIINIGNEPYGNNNCQNWVDDTIHAIRELREAGFEHKIMVDAPNWGQDWSQTMKNNAPKVYESDPEKDIVFSIHMYGVYNSPQKVKDYMQAFKDRGLPLVVGEFGYMHTDGDPDEKAIVGYAKYYTVGCMGWSWCGNGNGVEYLDMVRNWDPETPTPWGRWFKANVLTKDSYNF